MMRKFIYQFEAMSTSCELFLYATQKQHADSAAQAVLKETKRLEAKYNYYDEHSYLSQINSRVIQTLDGESKTLLQRAKQYYKCTNGIFDITVATLKTLYQEECTVEALEKRKIELLKFTGCEHFEIKRETIRFDNPHTKIDLGGFVKEYAVDRAVYILKKEKITAALVNYGGDIYALGQKPDGTSFRVGIKDPDNRSLHVDEVTLQDQALTTSASYERYYTVAQQQFSHIISKGNVSSTARSVTVISHNCVESGVYSTALMVDPTLKSHHKSIIL